MNDVLNMCIPESPIVTLVFTSRSRILRLLYELRSLQVYPGASIVAGSHICSGWARELSIGLILMHSQSASHLSIAC